MYNPYELCGVCGKSRMQHDNPGTLCASVFDDAIAEVTRIRKSQQEKWDRRYLELAKFVAENWSRDPSTKVGAIVVNHEFQQEFIGFNGFPRGVNDTPERYADREMKYKMIVHAEANAIRKAGHLAKGATLYVYPSFALPPVCNECAKDVIQAGIKEIVGYEPDMNDPRVQRWMESIAISKLMCEEAGVTWRALKEK